MTRNNADRRRPSQPFAVGNQAAARYTQMVFWLTAMMMLVEIAAGWFYNSMALVADGFHMGPQALVAGSSTFALAAAPRHPTIERVVYGGSKTKVLGRFASGILLLLAVALLLTGSLERLFEPQPIRYREAILVASLGLVVNGVSALILEYAQHRPAGEHPGHAADGHAPRNDMTVRSSYVDILADAATSMLALTALIGGVVYGFTWMDPAAGALGAVVVGLRAKRLWSDSNKVPSDSPPTRSIARSR